MHVKEDETMLQPYQQSHNMSKQSIISEQSKKSYSDWSVLGLKPTKKEAGETTPKEDFFSLKLDDYA